MIDSDGIEVSEGEEDDWQREDTNDESYGKKRDDEGEERDEDDDDENEVDEDDGETEEEGSDEEVISKKVSIVSHTFPLFPSHFLFPVLYL